MIDKLQFLIALSQTKHFGQVAEATGVSQPTLSGAIKLGYLTMNIARTNS